MNPNIRICFHRKHHSFNAKFECVQDKSVLWGIYQYGNILVWVADKPIFCGKSFGRKTRTFFVIIKRGGDARYL